MLILRVYQAIAKLNVALKSDNWRVKLSAEQVINLKAARDSLLKFLENPVDINQQTAEHLQNVEPTLRSLQLIPHAEYHLKVIEMTGTLFSEYLGLMLSLRTSYPAAHYQIMQVLLEKGDESMTWMFDELIQLECHLPFITPREEHFPLFLKDDNFQSLREVLGRLVYNYWSGIIGILQKLASDKEFIKKVAALPEVAKQFEEILDIPCRLKSLLDQVIVFDTNVSKLQKRNEATLSRLAQEFHDNSWELFHEAETRKVAFKIIRKLNQMRNYLFAELNKTENTVTQTEIANDIKHATHMRDKAQDILTRKAIGTLESKHQFKKVNANELNDLLAQLESKLEHPQQLTLWKKSSSSEALATTNLMDSIMVTSSSSSRIAASVYAIPPVTTQDELVFQGTENLHPELKRLLVKHYREDQKAQIIQSQLDYIKQPNRSNLNLFYNSLIAKFQMLYIGHMGAASGVLQQAHSADAMKGDLLNGIGTILGPFGGIIFKVLGTAITTAIQRKERIQAKNIAYLGMQGDVMREFEEFARELTLQFELQIRLLKTVKDGSKDNLSSSNGSSNSTNRNAFFSSKDKLVQGLRDLKLLSSDVKAPQVLAEFAVGMIFAKLLLTDKPPENKEQFRAIMYEALLEQPLSEIATEYKVFDLLGFYSFEVHRSGEKWHASDLFRKPTISVENADGSIDYWGKLEDGTNRYYSRVGTIEEAQKLGYVVLNTQKALPAPAERLAIEDRPNGPNI